MARVYVASPLAEARTARELALYLHCQGHQIVSTWHTVVQDGERDPRDRPTRHSLLVNCLREVGLCEILVALTAIGHPKMTYSEITAAVLSGRRVVWVQGPLHYGASIIDAHPLVDVVVSERPTAILEAVNHAAKQIKVAA